MEQTSQDRVIRDQKTGLTDEQAREIRVRALRFVLDCYERKKATRPGGPEDARKDQDARTTHIIPE